MPTNPDTSGRMKVTAATVVEDRACVGCGYDLKGLAFDAKCPECGTAVVSSAGNSKDARRKRSAWGLDDNLGDAPIPYLMRIGLAFACVFVGGLGLLVVTVFGLPRGLNAWFMVAAGPLACVWILSCQALAAPRPAPRIDAKDGADTHADGSKLLRWSVAVSQSFVGLIVIMMAMRWGGTASWLEPVQWTAIAIVVLGMIPLAVVLSNYAEWAGDQPMMSRLRGVAWVLGASLFGWAVVSVLQSVHFIFMLVSWIGVLSFLGWFAAFVVMCFSALQMVWMTRWAVRNRREAIARDARKLERARAANVAAAVKLKLADESEASNSLLPPPGVPLPGERTQHRIEPSKATPYELEDTNPSR